MSSPRDKDFTLDDIENINCENRQYQNYRHKDLKQSSPGLDLRLRSRMGSASDRKRPPFIDVFELLRIISNISYGAMILANPKTVGSVKDSCQLGEDISSLIGTLEEQNEALSKAAEGSCQGYFGGELKDAIDSIADVVAALMKVVNEGSNLKSSQTIETLTRTEYREVESATSSWRGGESSTKSLPTIEKIWSDRSSFLVVH